MWQKIKLILHSIREYKKYAIITPILMVLEAACECALPFIMSMFIDKMEVMKELNEIWPYVGLLIGIAIVSLTCGLLGGVTAAKASCGLAKNLRNDMYRKLQSFSFANIDKFSTSSLVTRMTTDVNNTQMAFAMTIRMVVRAPLMLLFSVIMAFVSGGLMAFIFIGIIPLIGIGFFFIIKNAMAIFMKVFKRYDALNQSVQENVSGIRVVKSFVREWHEQDKFNKASDSMKFDFIKAEKIVAFANPLVNGAVHLTNILICSIGSWLIYSTAKTATDAEGKIYIIYGDLSVGQLSSLLTYGVQILMSLMMISLIFVMLTMSLECIRRIAEVLMEEPTILNPDNPINEIKSGSVDFNRVSFKYSSSAERDTLHHINLHIKSGQTIGVIGSTGSGKTSLVNLISRLYDVSEGEILVDGIDVRKYDLKTLRDNVAVVLQKNVLFSGTIEENLRWGDIDASDEEIINACKIAQAHDFIASFPDGYNTKITQGGTNVSGGQKQRLCIARAILKKPKVLIFDDSTSAVDTKTDKLIQIGLKEQIPNTTKIIIAQRISSIEKADQIIVMDDGHIDAIGNHESLLENNKIYQEVYYSQNKKGGK